MNFSVHHIGKIPLHHQVENITRRLIANAGCSDRHYLPKEIELAGSFGASRSTIRQAFDKQQQGVEFTSKKVGTTVAWKKPISNGTCPWCNYTHGMYESGLPVIDLQFKIAWMSADKKRCVFQYRQE